MFGFQFSKKGVRLRFLQSNFKQATTTLTWQRDPLSHPDLRHMSLEQLADLPFEPTRIR